MTTRGRPPLPLLVACALVGIEALALVVLAVLEVGVTESAKLTMGLTTAAFFLVYGAGLAVCAWQLRRLRSWARAPVVLAQLIQLGVAWSFRSGATTVVAVLLAVAALVVLAGVLHPASLQALAEEDRTA